MKSLVLVFVLACVSGALAQCSCPTMKWALCDGSPCQCTVPVGTGDTQVLNCSTLVPKCFLMRAEMYRARNGLSTRSIGGKPSDYAVVDNDGIYDPDCESNGRFKARQCNNTDVCWCVNSAGVRRSDKSDKNLKCEELVETYWVRLELKHNATASPLDQTQLKTAVGSLMQTRYGLNPSLISDFQYDPTARLMVVDVQKPKGERQTDLARMAYYMEKDVKALPLFLTQTPFQPVVSGQPVSINNILVYYVDEKMPTITMQHLTGGVIAVIVIVILAVLGGLLVLFLTNRKKARGEYQKTQAREMDAMQQRT